MSTPVHTIVRCVKNGYFHTDILLRHKTELENCGFIFDDTNKATYPTGWVITLNPIDPRNMTCTDASGKIIFTMFVKDSGYDNYASLCWVKNSNNNE